MTEPPRDPRAVLREHGLWAKKRFGQSFLVAPHVPERITAAGGAGPDDVVFEIGCGVGTLTHALAARAGRVVALEHDRDLVPVSRAELAYASHVEIREGNVLDVNWPALAAELGGPPLVYGNLPYHLSTPILFALLGAPAAWRRACFLLQLEFATRVAAAPGEKACGAISAPVALLTRPRLAFRVGSGCFHPRPKVDSAVLVLDRLPAPAADVGDLDTFRTVVRALFQKRRKMARAALRGLRPDAEGLLLSLGLDPTRRGETFTLEELAAVSRALI